VRLFRIFDGLPNLRQQARPVGTELAGQLARAETRTCLVAYFHKVAWLDHAG
jgi:hypothetical protein